LQSNPFKIFTGSGLSAQRCKDAIPKQNLFAATLS